MHSDVNFTLKLVFHRSKKYKSRFPEIQESRFVGESKSGKKRELIV